MVPGLSRRPKGTATSVLHFACFTAVPLWKPQWDDSVNQGCAPSSRRAQQSTGLLHLRSSNLLCVNTIPIKNPPHRGDFLVGGLEEIRTPDPHNANVVRSQLRYKPEYLLPNYSPGKRDCQAFLTILQGIVGNAFMHSKIVRSLRYY